MNNNCLRQEKVLPASVLPKLSGVVVFIYSRVESGLDDPDNLGHLGHFLVGQVGLICKLDYLDVTGISRVL